MNENDIAGKQKIIKIREENAMDVKDIITLVQTVSDSNLKSFLYQEGNIKLYFEAEHSPSIQYHNEVDENRTEGKSAVKEQQKGRVITSPMVGTFYSSSSEGVKPYVNIGDTVKQGQIIGIVEAMKLMNEIESPYDGVVKEIKVKNKDMVGFGQELIVIE